MLGKRLLFLLLFILLGLAAGCSDDPQPVDAAAIDASADASMVCVFDDPRSTFENCVFGL